MLLDALAGLDPSIVYLKVGNTDISTEWSSCYHVVSMFFLRCYIGTTLILSQILQAFPGWFGGCCASFFTDGSKVVYGIGSTVFSDMHSVAELCGFPGYARVF